MPTPVHARPLARTAALVTLLLASTPALAVKGYVEFCNKSSKVVKFAVGFDAGGAGSTPVSRGWYVVQPCQCKQALDQEIAAAEIFVFASKMGGVTQLWRGTAFFCVHPSDAFRYADPTNRSKESCDAKGGRWVKFNHHDTQGKGVKVTYRAGTSTCID